MFNTINTNLPLTNPEKIFTLRDSAYANDLFITAVAYLDIFNFLNDNSIGFSDLCKKLNLSERPADVMITLLKSYGFVKERNKKLFLSDISQNFLINDSIFDLSSYVASLKDRPSCIEMLKVLHTGKPSNWASKKNGADWATAMNDEKFAGSFTESMNSRGIYLANGILDCMDFSNAGRVLDIGGASGIYSAVLLEKYPHLSVTVFEKPPVNKVAEYFINKYKLKNMNVIAGDMFTDDLPAGFDIHILSHVLHDWDTGGVETILRNSYNSLAKGGSLIIHDAHINERKDGPVSVAEYSALLMFSTYGKCYSVAELKEILTGIGFRNIKFKNAFINRSVIIAEK